MGVTISTHNGSAVSREHNIRNPKVVSKEPHIDMNGSHEVWIDEPVRKAYDRLFGEAVEAYNAKQARPERQIKSYYNDICKDSKKHPVYEMIIGIYGKNENGSPICSAEQGKEIMRRFVEEWQERNPNLELIGAYFHADEPGADPHVHLDYIPVAHRYTRGLETQTGLVKALGEQGFEKKGKATAQIQWEKRENDYLTKLCEDMGLTVDHPKIEGRKHIDTQELKLQVQLNAFESKINTLRSDFEKIPDIKQDEEKKLSELKSELNKTNEKLLKLKIIESNLTELINIQPKKNTLIGNDCIIALNDWKKMKATAVSGCKAIAEVERLRKENERLVKTLESQKDFTRKKLKEDYMQQADNKNKNRLLCDYLGIPEKANYDQTKRLLQKQGLGLVKNKNLGR